MKKVLKSIMFIVAVAVMTSCEVKEKSPLPLANVQEAPFVTIEIESPVIDVTQIATSTYGGVLKSPSNNVTSHTFSARLIRDGVASPFAEVYSTTSFPATMALTAGDILGALGLDPANAQPGDQFDFAGTTVGNDGSTVEFSNLGVDIAGEAGQNQAYKLTTFISCPFDQAAMVGTYTVTDDPGAFFLTNMFDVIAGPEANQITLLNPLGSSNTSYELVIDVSPGSGIATATEQPVIDTPVDYGFAGFGPTRFSGGSGFVFSCTGTISMSGRGLLTRLSDGAGFAFNANIAFIAVKN